MITSDEPDVLDVLDVVDVVDVVDVEEVGVGGLASSASSASGCLVTSTSYQCANNRVEQTNERTRVRERGMSGAASRRFKWTKQAQRFVTAHAAVQNLFLEGT